MQRNNTLVKGLKAVLGSQGLGQSLAQLNVNQKQELEIRGASLEEQNTIHVIRPSMVDYHKKQISERKKLINRELKKMKEERRSKSTVATKRIKFSAPSNDAPPVSDSFVPEDSAYFNLQPKVHVPKRITATSSTTTSAENCSFKNGEPVPESLLCDFLKRKKYMLEGDFEISHDFLLECLSLSGAIKAARLRPEEGMVIIVGANTCPDQRQGIIENNEGLLVICESDVLPIAVTTHEAETKTRRAWEASPVLNPPKPKIIHSDASPASSPTISSTTGSSSSSGIPALDCIEEAVAALNKQQTVQTQTAASLVNDISAMKSLRAGKYITEKDLMAACGGFTVDSKKRK